MSPDSTSTQSPFSSLEALGSLLRQAREAKGITLNQAAHATLIRTLYLEALETGDLSQLPETVYIRGFLKCYANYLDLDAEVILEHSAHLFTRDQSAPDLTAANPPITFDLKRWHLWLLYIALIMTTIGGLTSYLNQGQLTIPTLPFGTWFTSSQPTPTATPTAAATPAPKPSPTPTANPGKPVQVKIRLIERASWLRILVDGQTVFEGTLQPGSERQWSAQNAIVVRAGNAGSVDVTFNAKKLGVMGQFGEVKEQTFTKPQ